ncbi:aspartate aminotransferase family protein [Pseudarthrobacter albicanus]|uniref:aspartate aminotransferase family protein n=1 Tax=Pseudarthrobacter albicanus TaxID=2823873 RepID=UPI001BAE2CE3|nr:aspartate aminotransferase family protein [Pseudarthrobacter albicanus]
MRTLYQRDARVMAGIEKLRFFPLEVVEGRASTLIDPAGRELLDLSATWTASGLGHGHPAVVDAVTKAAATAPGAGTLSAVHPDAVALAEELLALVPGSGERRVYLGHAGSDANDVALRACRHYSGRRTVLAFERSYHGGLGTAMAVSGQQADAGHTQDPDVVFLPYPNPLRPLTGDIESTVDTILGQVRRELEKNSVACLIVEPILSDGGLVVPPRGFLTKLQALCREFGVPLICDEVKVGLGRPGALHAFSDDGIEPDIAVFGKALGGGLPLSAAVGPADILDHPAASALLTTAGNPVCTAAGRAVLRTLIHDGLPARAREAGNRFMASLHRTADGHGTDGGRSAERIGDVRGRGLAIGVELVKNRSTLEPDRELAQRVVYRAWQLGAVVYYVGGNVLEITPPLVITDAEIDSAAAILDQAISDAMAGKVKDEEVEPYVGW